MCGIVGFKTSKQYLILKEDLSKAVITLRHRGPDDEGLFFDEGEGLGLGHRRLSIIDLSESGHQPMASDDGEIHIVYNGEVYNFHEIRNELWGSGYRFFGSSDTEVILKAYQHWGLDCVKKFVGMFAIAIWDKRSRRLVLIRDRLGIKPLFYYYRNGIFLFASELKALMAFSCFHKEIDTENIASFLHYQYVPGPKSIFKNTFKLEPGCRLIYDINGLQIQNYWQLPSLIKDEKIEKRSEEDVLETLDTIMSKAVSDRLISDVPLGALFSGGIDSSLVVALMQKACATRVKTYSIGFREAKYDEAPWASRIAAHLGTDHHELYVTEQEAREVIPQLPEIYDEPFADSSAIPTFLVSKLARAEVTVALSGDGGDEHFAGYVRYWATYSLANHFRRLPYSFRKRLSTFLAKIPDEWAEKGYSGCRPFLPQRFQVNNFLDKWQKAVSFLKEVQFPEMYRMSVCLWPADILKELLGAQLPRGSFEAIFNETEGWPLLSRLMRVDQKTYLPDAMLTKIDRASMAVGLEARVPLLDHRLVEYAVQLPDNLKYRNGSGKYILKKLLARYIPLSLFNRPKMGFGIPLGSWLRKELKPLLLDYLNAERIKKEGLLNEKLIDKTIQEHLSGKINHQYRLWALLMWEMWRDRWMKNSS